MNWFNRRKLSDDFVSLSIGKVYFFEVTHLDANVCENKSTIGGVSHSNLYLQLMEYRITDLSKRKVDRLSIRDGNLLREKVKNILIQLGLFDVVEPVKVKDEDDADLFCSKDEDWFANERRLASSKVQASMVRPGVK